jgi:hypothetical protein
MPSLTVRSLKNAGKWCYKTLASFFQRKNGENLMAILHLVDGRKGDNDILVLIEAYTEPLSLPELLFIIKCVLQSEDSYYPISEGKIGKAMFLNAVNELACGVPFNRVLERYGLNRKGKSLRIIDKRKRKPLSQASFKPIEKLSEVL